MDDMKVLVNKLPTDRHECLYWVECISETNNCQFAINKLEYCDCRIGEKDFKCPYLKEFEAYIEEPILGHPNVARRTPVKLDD